MRLAKQPEHRIEYILRHVPPENIDASKRSYLSGYSVALDLKKMDYLALDDRHISAQQTEQSNSDSEQEPATIVVDPIISLIDSYPENPTAPDANTPPTEDELRNIGFQATQLIMDSPNPLLTLKHLSQNFPKYVTSLARRVVVDERLASEVHENQLRVSGGISAMWINGVAVQEKDINAFGLLRLLKKERGIMAELMGLGLEKGEAVELLTHPSISAGQDSKDLLDGLVDSSDSIEGGEVIIWWNDIEKDKRLEYLLLHAAFDTTKFIAGIVHGATQ